MLHDSITDLTNTIRTLETERTDLRNSVKKFQDSEAGKRHLMHHHIRVLMLEAAWRQTEEALTEQQDLAQKLQENIRNLENQVERISGLEDHIRDLNGDKASLEESLSRLEGAEAGK